MQAANTDEATRLELSLGDVALLAHVQRPVPSMWRIRSAGTDLPFPEPVARVGTEERFDVDSVVAWLEATGRGCNPEARADAAAYASPVGLSLRDPTLHAGLTALLCLKAMTAGDVTGFSTAGILDLAVAADPDDVLLRTELAVVKPHLLTLAAYADALAEAAYGPAPALERLLDQRFRRGPAQTFAGSLAAPARTLCAVLGASLARDCGSDPATYVSATSGGGDLLVSLVAAPPDAVDVVLLDGATPGGRLLRRRLRVLGVQAETTADLASVGPAVVIAHYPVEAPGTAPRRQALDALDELALTLTDEHRALVLAPASLLTDRLVDREVQQQRSRVLRTGRVRAVVRLPAGLAPHRSREALALWVLGPEVTDHRMEDRRIAVADISGASLTRVVVDQLRDDVLAALAPPAIVRARSFALARLVATSSVLAQSGALFPPAAVPPPVGSDGRQDAIRVERLRSRGNASDVLGGVTVRVIDGPARTPVRVGQAVEQRLVRIIPGNREGFVPRVGGSLPVIGVPELSGELPAGSRHLDRLTFLGSQAAARLTEAGDVVFCTSPGPHALVDAAGGSAVQSPARILRIDPLLGEGLCSDVVAHAINSRDRGGPWRSWLLHRIDPTQVPQLSAALMRVDVERSALRRRLDEIDQLRDSLVHAVTSGTLALTDPDPKDS